MADRDELGRRGEQAAEAYLSGHGFEVVASKDVPADDKPHDITFNVKVDRSSWVALRQFPQLHTNPVNVLVKGEPIRASRRSAVWCLETVEQLWRVRENAIAEPERDAAHKTFRWAVERYRRHGARTAGPLHRAARCPGAL